jgi:hypothetical protein
MYDELPDARKGKVYAEIEQKEKEEWDDTHVIRIQETPY